MTFGLGAVSGIVTAFDGTNWNKLWHVVALAQDRNNGRKSAETPP
jgi:hypothetical protein